MRSAMQEEFVDSLHLNQEQLAALQDPASAILVVAGAGTGKTRVLTCRIAHLIAQQQVPPEAILAVTFSNKAAREMAERVAALLPFGLQPYSIGTFHAICGRLLREFGEEIGIDPRFTIFAADDQKQLMKRLLKEMQLDTSRYSATVLLWEMEQCKNNAQNAEEFASDPIHKSLFRAYREALIQNNAQDFGDLLYNSVRLLKECASVRHELQQRYQQILVDEYQDINQVQKEFITLLKGEDNSIFVVGDEDQSIYGWRGADINYILQFDRDFKNTSIHKLEENYRSSQIILDVANAVIAHNTGRRGKNLWTRNSHGKPVNYLHFPTEKAEAEFVILQAMQACRNAGVDSGETAAIFYRTNAQSRVFEEAAMRHGIPYQIVGGLRFYERMEIKDTLAFLRFVYNPADSVSFTRIVKALPCGIGNKTLEKVFKQAASENGDILAALRSISTLSRNASKKVQQLAELLARLYAIMAGDLPLANRVEQLLLESGYLENLRQQGTEEAQNRIDNIYELLNSVEDFAKANPQAGLADFLQHVSLLTDVDEMRGDRQEIILMTLHASKGLEFDTVCLTGMEEGIFPHSRSMDTLDEIEEERRLCYVGMTRAKRELFLSSCASRKIYHNVQYNPVSRFLQEVPEELLQIAYPGFPPGIRPSLAAEDW